MKTKSLSRHLNGSSVPQSQQLDSRQVKNSAGGWTYEVGCWDQLKRFLILGTTGGTYYVSEQKLTKTNVDSLKKCLDSNIVKYVDMVFEISDGGRAAKNDYAIFALAYACVHSEEARKEALKKLNGVCRIGTHLFQFMEDYKTLGGGFGRGFRTAISNWYLTKSAESLSNQIIKYRNRNNWTHRDVLRLAHTKSEELNSVLRYAVKGFETEMVYTDTINAFESLKTATPKDAVSIINKYDVTREFLPTELLTNNLVLDALAMKMPITAMIRNLGNMTRVLEWTQTTKSKSLERTLDNLDNPDVLKKGRVHPMFVLTALRQYELGSGMSTKWTVNSRIVSGLNKAFKHSVKSSIPTKLRILQALDTSGSMSAMAGSNFTCKQAGASMALVTACVEPYVRNMDFNSKVHNDNVVLHENMSVSEAISKFNGSGGTSLELPVQWAIDNKEAFDLIIIFSDNETWSGSRHLSNTWNEYRKKNPQAKLVIASCAANQYTVGDPDDSSVLQTVGFDADLLEVIKTWATT